jgi:alanine racemase
MDQCMVNLGITGAVARYDNVVVFGGGGVALSAADVAAATGTIPYEITCGINKRVPRVHRD